MRDYLLPGLIYLLSAAGLYLLRDHALFWLPLTLSVVATLWWVVVAVRAEGPRIRQLVVVLAPLALPWALGWQALQAMEVNDSAAVAVMVLEPFILALIAFPAGGFMVLLLGLLFNLSVAQGGEPDQAPDN